MRVKTAGARGEGGWARVVRLAAIAAVVACTSKNDGAPPDTVSGSGATAKSSATADPRSSAAPRERSILFVGTSLTAGLGLEQDSAYPALIQRKIDSAHLAFTVTNAGVSGETTAGLLERLDWLLRGTFDVMVVESGANDGLRGIPAATVRANLSSALDQIKARRPEVRVALVQMEVLPNLGPRYAAEFRDVYPALAKAKGVTLVPFLLDGVAGRTALNQADGIHPNDAGERIVAENVWRSLEPILRQVAADGGRGSP